MDLPDPAKSYKFQLLLLVIGLIGLVTALVPTPIGQQLFGGMPAQQPPQVPTTRSQAKSSLIVEKYPVVDGDAIPVASVKLISEGAAIANGKVALFRLPRVPQAEPLAVRVTDAEGIVVLPLPGLSSDTVLLAEFTGDDTRAAATVEIRCK